MGSTVAETVITVMKMDASNYIANSKKVIGANDAMITSSKQLQAAYAKLQGMLQGVDFGGGNTFNFGGGGSGGGGGMGGFGGLYIGLRVLREVERAFVDMAREFKDFSQEALTQYSTFDTLTRSFEGIYGSGAKANQMIGYLRDTSKTAAFHFRDLADAARSISVAGLDVNRFLPMAQGYSLSMGKRDGEGLQDFISILRRIEGGNTGVALGPRGIGRYGIGRNELEGAGANFDAHGHFVGSANDAFDVLEKIFKDRIKGIADQTAKSTEVVLSDFGDMVDQATIDFGHGVADNMIDPIKKLTEAGNQLRSSGVIKDLADTIFSILDIDGMMGEAPKVTKDSLRSWLKNRPAYDPNDPSSQSEKMLQSLPVSDITKILVEIGSYIVELVMWAKLTTTEVAGLLEIASKVSRGALNIATFGGSELLYGLYQMITGKTPSNIDLAQQQGDAFRTEAANSIFKGLAADLSGKKGAPGAPIGNEHPGQDDDKEPEATTHLRKIREHTSRIAQHFDMRATSFGGGDIGRLGVTPVEMGKFKHGAGGGHGVARMFEVFGSNLQAEFHRMLSEAQLHGLQQGFQLGSARG